MVRVDFAPTPERGSFAVGSPYRQYPIGLESFRGTATDVARRVLLAAPCGT